MASGGSGGVSVPALWSEVNRYGQNGDFTRALKTVNKILQINKDDVTALHCKVVCLIQNGSFKEALNVINTHTKVLANNSLSFEKAYCEYRLNRIENALKTIESANQQTDKLKELYGQVPILMFDKISHQTSSWDLDTFPFLLFTGRVLYRLERYDECLAVYRDLVRNSQDDYDEERKTNLSAVVAAQSNWEKVVPENLGLQEGTHELCYNAACALIGQGQLNQAMKILQKAEDLCRRSFSEDSDGTEEDPQAELAIIHGQMAYILQLQGRTEEALQLYNQIIKLKPTDVALLAVIANNIITINKDQNVFDSKKKVKLTNAEGVEFKLSKRQLQAIEFNKALLAMYTNQAEQCRKISASLQSQSPERLLPVLIQAAQLCREKQHTKAIELLQEFSDQHPENAAEIKLTMAQLKISQGNISKACLILRSIEELKHKPGMVSALVTMYSHEEDIDSAIEVFTQAIQWYQSHQPKSPAHLSLIREAANFKLKYGRKKEAVSDLEQLWKQNSKDIHTLAQLISAYSLVDPEKAKALSKHLPSSDSMSLKVDVEALENSPGATYIRKKGGKVTGDNQPKEQGQGDLKKKKKKKKGKLPKNYDPKVTPDPERWLPMRERSYYRGRKKGKKKDQIGKGTQGATAGASSELDASKTMSSPPTSPRPGSAATISSSTSNIVPPRHQKPAGAPATKKKQQQKKKKGGKSGW
ncbi:signal recognition particle protein [Cricetulus griseus]|uniref:Signal recognition particle subunit SRP72 n=2 Tax=Cricetulus griseus TaxID=10029 RepID=A0A061IQH6_CRIGR|nr:signal recognition particle protein [Cricetulus griseus]